MIREDYKNFLKTFTYSYDANGNITSKNSYEYTLASLDEIRNMSTPNQMMSN